ncbi:hypothetical protein EES39_37630 [Streptomyces sp. ADI92-24]|uniref:hypothetical protein n=2 Tax=Streptomyces TaxID=1883 RepID=UPI000F49D981|nr:hypothetical protein EDD95_7955 [Streptomyces sp. CEV 2-1]RPK33108.1 hypothetical protein EES39_37630 [Streptomyces sp. ADI92-24]
MQMDARSRRAPRGALALAAVAVLAAGLAGCSEDKETLASWSAKGGKEQAKVIGDDIHTLLQLVGNGDAAQCRQVLDHVKTARAFRRLPDGDAQSSWEETLNRMETAATTCVQNPAGITGGPELTEAADAQQAYGHFAIRITALTGSKS